MGGVTDLVRQALAELGPDAILRQVTDYVHFKDATVPRNYASLAMRNLRTRGLGSDGKNKPRRRHQ
jgi:hypothetical protein